MIESVELPVFVYYVLPLAVVFLWQLRRHGVKQHHNEQVLDDAVQSGLTAPASLHPVVNTSICIGCEACVHACPEYPKHDVLGVIKGKAGLISPTDCIGHGACKTACPVGAISLVFGTSERGVDIPIISPQFETNLPGLFIAGELGGMGLIRNAIEQGRQAMDAISARLGDGGKARHGKGAQGPLDVLIVGAGPAGLSATLRAHEQGHRYVTIEQSSLGGTVAHFPRGKVVMTAPVHLAMVGQVKFGETEKERLIEFWNKVEADTGINIHYNEQLTGLERTDKGFTVETMKNSYRARYVLLALGRRGTPRTLDVPGEDLPKVIYSLVDPYEFDGKHVLVVGGGDSALEAAHTIADRPDTTVTLSYRSASFSRAKRKNRDKVEQYAADGRLNVMMESQLNEITSDTVVLTCQGKQQRLPNEGVIICAGGILPTGFLENVGITVETKYGTA